MRVPIALLVLLTGPILVRAEGEGASVSVQALLAEADALAQEARSRHASAHDMKPSTERNEILSKARSILKQAIGKYELLGDLAAEHRKHASTQVSDLKGLLFWCNKSFAVMVPPRLASPPPVPAPVEGSARQPDTPPPPDPTPAFSEADSAEVLRLLGLLKGLHEKVEEAGDRIAQAKAAIADLYAVLDASHKDWEAKGGAVGWNQVKAYEVRRDAMLADTRKHQKAIQTRLKEIRRLQDEIRGGQSLLEWFGPPSLPTLAGWVSQAPEGSLPEALVAYVNRQMETPSWGFTRLGSAAPAEASLDAAKVAASRKVLDEAAKLHQRDADLEVLLAEGEVERDRLEREIADLTAHWAWRQEHSAWSMDHLKLMEQRKSEARKAIEKLAVAEEKARAERVQIAAKRQPLDASLEALDPSMGRVVESWRRKRPTVPAALEEVLERWARRIDG